MTIKRKMTILISSMLMLVVLLSIVFIYNESSNILKSEAEKYMEAQLNRANENITLLLNSTVLETEKLSLEPNVINYFSNSFSQEKSDDYLDRLMDEKNENERLYFDLFLVSKEGIIVSAAMKEAVGVDVSSRSYFNRAVKDQSTKTSDIILSRADKTQIVISITPAYNEKKESIGYACVAIYATYFSNFLDNFNVSDTSDYIIIDSFDHIVSHPNKKMISSKFNYFGLRKESISTVDTIVYNNETYKILQRDLGFNNWKIISYLKYDEIYSKSMELAYSFMKLGGVAIFIAVGFGVYLTDFISRPIVAMTESINRILENEENFHHKRLLQFPVDAFDDKDLIDGIGFEPTEVSNFRKAIIGFRSALEQGAEKFEVEHSKLKHYIDGLYKELENINKRNLDFIATFSHDIRTPLTLIKGYARGLESGEITDPAMKAKFKTGIVTSADAIEHLVYNVLDFAYELDCGASFEFETYTYDEIIHEIIFELKQLYNSETHRMKFETTKDKGIEKYISVDMNNIKRVVTNLINNSIKYTDADAPIVLKIMGTESGIVFEVYDQGKGIRDRDLEYIYDMFFRTEDSKATNGYGLGLYISQQILKAHESQLMCTSTYGIFTKMTFIIPWSNNKINP